MTDSLVRGPADKSGGSIQTNPDGSVGEEPSTPTLIPVPSGAPSATAVAAIPGRWIRILPIAGGVSQAMPPIGSGEGQAAAGVMMAVSNYSATFPLSIVPTLPNTINNSPGSTVVGVNQNYILISDGVSDWRIIGSYTKPSPV